MTKNLIKAIGKHSFTKSVLLTICLTLSFAFYSCKHQHDGEQIPKIKPILTSCNVDGKALGISDHMDAGKTKKEKVLVKTTHSPKDAIVKYEKPLDSDGYWALSLGENTLKIVVEKGNEKKEYTVKIKREKEGENQEGPALTSLSIFKTEKKEDEISDNMAFAVPVDFSQNEFQVVAKANVEGAQIECTPPPKRWKNSVQFE